MKLRRSVVVTVVTGIAASLAAAPAQAGGPPTRVEWGGCPEEVAVVSPTLRCATVPVPLDYRDPDGAKIDIVVFRIMATYLGNLEQLADEHDEAMGKLMDALPAEHKASVHLADIYGEARFDAIRRHVLKAGNDGRRELEETVQFLRLEGHS